MTSASFYFQAEYMSTTSQRLRRSSTVLLAVTKPPCSIPRYMEEGDVNFKVFFGDLQCDKLKKNQYLVKKLVMFRSVKHMLKLAVNLLNKINFENTGTGSVCTPSCFILKF